MQIRIKGYSFQISTPFTEGTVLTRAEAQALNALRTENIQNNLRKLITDAVDGLPEGQLLSDQVLEELQRKLTTYDLAYQFVEKHTPRLKLGDIEAEARAIAEERVEAELRQTEQTVSDEDRERLISVTEALPAVIEEARARVSARRVVAGSLSDL